MSLVAVPPAPASPPDTVVTAGEWYPDIDCNRLRAELRIGEVVTHERLAGEVRAGLIEIMGELRAWRIVLEGEGHPSLASASATLFPGDEVDGQALLEYLFIRAVHCAAAANLAETHRDLSVTNDGAARAEAHVLSAADYRRMKTWAVRDMLGTTRTAVELI